MYMVEEVQNISLGVERGIICKAVRGFGRISIILYGVEVWGCCRQVGPLM